MKKVLAVLLSVMMLFGALTFSSSAVTDNSGNTGSLIDTLRATGVINSNQVVLCFDLQTGTMYGKVPVYNKTTNKFVQTEGVTGIYHMIPDNSQTITGTDGSYLHTAGSYVILPSVIPPAEKVFDGWEYTNYETGERRVYSAGSRFEIPEGDYKVYSDKAVLYFTALYSPAEIEGDIFDTILNVLLGVVGKVLELLGINIDLDGLIGGLL